MCALCLLCTFHTCHVNNFYAFWSIFRLFSAISFSIFVVFVFFVSLSIFNNIFLWLCFRFSHTFGLGKMQRVHTLQPNLRTQMCVVCVCAYVTQYDWECVFMRMRMKISVRLSAVIADRLIIMVSYRLWVKVFFFSPSRLFDFSSRTIHLS